MSAAPEAVVAPGPSLPALIGESPAFLEAMSLAQRFAATEVPVLLVGATGTGKELVAQHIHRWSGRGGPLVDINCAAIPSDIADSILFGHRRGAFSGAVESRVGLLEEADGGTLLLDELGSLPVCVQGKLLRVLETGWIRRVGETGCRAAQFRIISASHHHLNDAVAAGTFRMDLFQRLGGVQITLPPLAERDRDVLLLAQAFAAAAGRHIARHGDDLLLGHTWPGNVRELRWAIERARWLSHEEVLNAAVLHQAIALGAAGPLARTESTPGPVNLDLVAVCEAQGWDATRAAAALGIHRATLWRRLRAYGISLRQRKSDPPSPIARAFEVHDRA